DESSFFLNKKVLLSFGAMRTQIDDVRFLQNSSSGRMGFELALSLLKKGAYLHLLAGICDAGVESELLALAKNNPSRIQLMRFAGVSSYEKSLKGSFLFCDLFMSAAAVLDFEVEAIQGKLERTKRESLSLNVKATQDYVAWAAQNKKSSQKIVAFALESGTWQEAIDRAKKKLLRKGADSIVVNRSGVEGEGPFASTNQVLVMNRGELGLGDSRHLIPSHSLSKAQAVEYILNQLSWELEKSEPVLEAR
ncbi:MAG: phosphopantothenoylcysteine decarboxylase, partial [bacterium]